MRYNMKNENKKLIGGVSIATLLGAVVSGAITNEMVNDSELVEEQVQALNEAADEIAQLSEAKEGFEVDIEELSERLQEKGIQLIELRNQTETDKAIISDMESEIVALNEEIDRKRQELETVTEEVNTILYDIGLDGTLGVLIDNYDFDRLFDKTIEYNDEDYDIREEINISDSVVIDRDSDYEIDTVIRVNDRGAIGYRVLLDKGINVTSDEVLELPFMHETLRISRVNDGEVTLSLANEYFLEVDETREIDSKTVRLVSISDEQALFEVDGVREVIREGKDREVNGLRIEVDTVFKSQIGNSFVTFEAGETLRETVKDGDEYELDKDYVWRIDSDGSVLKSIGIAYDLRLRRENEVLAIGDEFSLPNDFATFSVVEADEYNYYDFSAQAHGDEIDIDLDRDADVRINGSREDERSFTINKNNGSIITPRDFEGVNITDVTFRLDRRDFEFDFSGGNVSLISDGQTIVEFSSDGEEFNVFGLNNKRNDYRTVFGDVVEGDIERNAENGELDLRLVNRQVKLDLIIN